MFLVKRTKGKAVHFATKVTPHGTVEGWSREVAEAIVVTPGMADRLRAHHEAHRKDAGEWAFLPIDATEEQLANAAAAKDDSLSAANFAKLQEECKRLTALAGELKSVASAAKHRAESAERAEQKAVNRLTEMEAAQHAQSKQLAERHAELEAKDREVEALRQQVAELEAALTTPDEPPPEPPPAEPDQKHRGRHK